MVFLGFLKVCSIPYILIPKSIYILFHILIYFRVLIGPASFCAQARWFGFIGLFFCFVDRLFYAQAWCFSYRLVFASPILFSETFIFMRRRGVSAWSGHLADLMCFWNFSESFSAAF